MKYIVEYSPKAQSDFDGFDQALQVQIRKIVDRTAQNPLPRSEGGYGNPLGNKFGHNLTGLYKIKLLKPGIRIVYELVRVGDVMKIVVIAARADNEVYDLAAARTGR